MKNTLLFAFVLLINQFTFAHEGGHGHDNYKEWTISTQHTAVKASFLILKKDLVFLEAENGTVVSYPFSSFSIEDQTLINQKNELIQKINNQTAPIHSNTISQSFWHNDLFIIILWSLGILFLMASVFLFKTKKKVIPFSTAIFSLMFMILASCSKDDDISTTSTLSSIPANDISTLQTYFNYFSNVSNSSDATYFYVASDGIANHNMMVGITAWIAQVPLPQSYTGSNAWSIPLQPELSDSPISIADDFQRGAIGIAVNGIPIFNPLNASGLVSNDIGELDAFGGHSGKGDDYHYHTAPVHLQSTTGTNPIAYALDGFAVYGSLEPDGSTMEDLDSYHGHEWNDNYHYHGTTTYPYMIGSMRGKVTISGTAPQTQIDPQPHIDVLRSTLHPINGVNLIITSCEANSSNTGYLLDYTIGGVAASVDYSWDSSNLYTFIFNDIDGTTTTETWQK